MPAVSSQLPQRQQSAVSFYASQKKKLFVSMKKKKSKRGEAIDKLGKAVKALGQGSSSTMKDEALLFNVQDKTRVVARPEKSFMPQINKQIKKTSWYSSSNLEMKNHGVEQRPSKNKKKNYQKLENHSELTMNQRSGKLSTGLPAKKLHPKSNSSLASSASAKSPSSSNKKVNGCVKKEQISTLSMRTKINTKTRELTVKPKNFSELLNTLNCVGNSKNSGRTLFAYLIKSCSHYPGKDFYSYFKNDFWESKPLLIQRKLPHYFDGLFSMDTFDEILREQYIEYTKNLDVTSYSDGVRQTHNPSGRAYAAVVWDYFSNGCSLRLLNPQTFHEPVWRTLSVLQELFGAFCGANIYLTPAGTQGFAPHWDDIEAFVLQLEGKKRWRVYNPRSAEEVLPRYSSHNLTQGEIGEPIIDVVLEPGDTLYFPRGYIHQAEAVSDTFSLHITISMYQKNTWVDVLEKIFSPASLKGMAAKDVSLRKGLPIGCIGYMGSTAAQVYVNDVWKNERCSNISDLRKKFKEEVMSRISSMLTEDVLDRAMDDFARQFVRVALPPCPTEADKECTVEYDGERWHSTIFRGRVEIEPETKIKLLGSSTLRVVQDWGDAKDEYRVYHSVENSREYEGREEQFVVVDKKHLPAVQHLIILYPRYTAVEDLPLATLEDKMTVAMSLWEQRLVITETPLPFFSDDYSSSSDCCSDSDD